MPDPRFHDRRYVLASRIGEGWVLYLAALGGVGEPATVRFEGVGEDAFLRLPGLETEFSPVVTDRNDRRAAYVRPAELIRPGPVTLVAGPELPDWVADALTEDASRVARVLEDRLGAPALTPPTILASYDPSQEGFSFKGGAMDGATMRLVMRSNLSEPNEATRRQLAGFTAHETVHVWLNEVWDTTENAEQPWLHEGAAEYLADRLSMEAGEFEKEAIRHVTDCLAKLGDRPLNGSDGVTYGAVPYDCGFTIQLAAEVASVRRGEGDALDLWRGIVTDAPDATYDSAAFIAAATRSLPSPMPF